MDLEDNIYTKKMYTIELNLDDDFASICAYHVADLNTTIERNIDHAENHRKTDRWVLIGLANSFSDAMDKCAELQILLCKKNNRKPYCYEKPSQDMGHE